MIKLDLCLRCFLLNLVQDLITNQIPQSDIDRLCPDCQRQVAAILDDMNGKGK